MRRAHHTFLHQLSPGPSPQKLTLLRSCVGYYTLINIYTCSNVTCNIMVKWSFVVLVWREFGKTSQRIWTAAASLRTLVWHNYRQWRYRRNHWWIRKGNGTSTHNTTVGARGMGILNLKCGKCSSNDSDFNFLFKLQFETYYDIYFIRIV